MREVTMYGTTRAALFGIVVASVLSAEATLARDSSAVSQGLKIEPILKSSKTADGEPLTYPRGDKPQIISVIVTIEPGGRTTLHRHPLPVFAYLLEGTWTVREEGHEPRVYKQGDAFLETVGHWHQGFNEGDKLVKLLAVFLSEEGMPTTEDK
jgi:quercetin dioxygenase-like cupin family protein